MPEGCEFTDPAVPDDQVKVEPFKGAGATSRNWWDPRTWRTEGWILEKRSFNCFRREEVPTMALRRVELVANGNTREVKQGDKCWTECEYTTRHWIIRRFVVSRWIEWWRVNTALKSYYDFVTGENIGVPAGVVGVAGTAMGVAESGAAATGVATAGTATYGAVAGTTITLSTGAAVTTTVTSTGVTTVSAGTTLAAGAGSVTAAGAVGAAGLGITIFVSLTYLMRHWVEDAVLISGTWELVRVEFSDEEIEREDYETVWRICGEIRDCPDPPVDPPVDPPPPPPPSPPPPPPPVDDGPKVDPVTPKQPWEQVPCLFWPLILVFIFILVVGWWVFIRDDGGSTATTPTEVPAAATSVTSPVAAASPSATPGLVTGNYTGTVTVKDDPAGHNQFITVAKTWNVQQVRNTQTNAITIALSNLLPGVQLTGPVPVSGQEFTATGFGTVAGNVSVKVDFTGSVSAEAGLSGVLAVGTNGSLPQGKAITYNVKMTKQP